jgi:hypothetical protein
MGIAKNGHLRDEDDARGRAWDERPIAWEVVITGDLGSNRAKSIVNAIVADEAVELHCVEETPDSVRYVGVYPTEKMAWAGIREFMARSGCHHTAI